VEKVFLNLSIAALVQNLICEKIALAAILELSPCKKACIFSSCRVSIFL